MKKGQIKLLVINISMIFILLLNMVFKFFSSYTYVLFLFVLLIITIKVIGFERKNTIYSKKDILYYIIMFCVFYNIITYITGFALGFLSSSYEFTFFNVLKHITPLILLIVVSEVLRYSLIRKGYNYKSVLILTIILMIIIDVSLKAKGFDLNVGEDVVKFLLTIVFPSIAKNIFLSYLTIIGGFTSCIVYRLLMELVIYILPISPNLGMYIDTTLKIIFPSVLALIVYLKFNKNDIKKQENNKWKITKKYLIIASILFMLVIIILTTGVFKYYTLVIGSNSMKPKIAKGDIVLVEKLKEKEINDLKIGEVLIFKHKKVVVIHRIVKIGESGGNKFFQTKGDNNNSKDPYLIYAKDVIGKSTLKIKYLGYPTVLVSELINK